MNSNVLARERKHKDIINLFVCFCMVVLMVYHNWSI